MTWIAFPDPILLQFPDMIKNNQDGMDLTGAASIGSGREEKTRMRSVHELNSSFHFQEFDDFLVQLVEGDGFDHVIGTPGFDSFQNIFFL